MISAIVLAAGESKRMGQPKMLLPWGNTTVIGKVVKTLIDAKVNHIKVVIGGAHTGIEEALKAYTVNYIFNQDYANEEMLKSAQLGLTALNNDINAALIVLGDQPQIEVEVVKTILQRYAASHHKIIVPSYKMHRGHPWLIDQALWQEIIELTYPHTLRDFLEKHSDRIDYIDVNTPSVLQDLDTPGEYSQYKP
jgi:molybdenum cofactor cytidylyltransferase